MHNIITLEFFEKYKCLGIAVLLQSSRYVSNEQPCLKTTGICDDLLFLSSFLFHIQCSHFVQLSYSELPFHLVSISLFYFIFSAPISFSLCFPISSSLFCCCSLFSSFNHVQQKSFCIACIVCIIHTYFRKLMNFCLAKKFIIFWLHLFK